MFCGCGGYSTGFAPDSSMIAADCSSVGWLREIGAAGISVLAALMPGKATIEIGLGCTTCD